MPAAPLSYTVDGVLPLLADCGEQRERPLELAAHTLTSLVAAVPAVLEMLAAQPVNGGLRRPPSRLISVKRLTAAGVIGRELSGAVPGHNSNEVAASGLV